MTSSQKFLLEFRKQIESDEFDKIIEFYITFSRFECALKQSIEFANITGGKVEPNWDVFVSRIRLLFNSSSSSLLKSSVQYLLKNPPKKQAINDSTIQWADNLASETSPEINKLLYYIKNVRNNLFHGGKFNGNFSEDESRNHRLINSCLVVLNNWLELHQGVKNLFLSPI